MLKLILLFGAAVIVPPPAASQSCLCADIHQRVETAYFVSKGRLVPTEEDKPRGRTIVRFFLATPRKQDSSLPYDI